MRSSTIVLRVVVLGVVGGMASAAVAGNMQEEELTLDQVPPAVKATILQEAGGAEIREIERGTEDGKRIYEAEFLVNGGKVEIMIAPDGTLLGREVEKNDDDEDDIAIDQVPEPARTVLVTLAGGAKITGAEREKEEGTVIFEAAWVTDDTEHKAAVTADGTLIEREETIPAERAPAAVRAAIATHFGANAKVVVEKKMIVVYELKGKIKGEEEELLVLPTGRVIEEPDGDDHKDDDDDHDHDGDDED